SIRGYVKFARGSDEKVPDTKYPATFSGGYVMGTFMIPHDTPFSDRMCHSAFPPRVFVLTTSRSYVPPFRCVKSKIPCFPGFIPVRNVDHAVGECGWIVEARGPLAPSRATRASVGTAPLS